MRRFGRSMLVMLLIAAAYYGLYLVKWEVRDLKQENTLLNAQIMQKEREIRVLQTEWAYLNRPERLKKLAELHLELAPMGGQQMAEFDSFRLPGPMQESAVTPAGFRTLGGLDY